MKELNVKGLALAGGIVWAIYMIFMGWAAAMGWGVGFVEMASSVYIGYAPSFLGGIIGAIWGFVDGAIFGALIGVFYNKFTE